MTKEELIKKLDQLWKDRGNGGDVEIIHISADNLLLDYIGDDDIRKAFDDIPKWYA